MNEKNYERREKLFISAIKAFENFKQYLKNKNSHIDYTYLWDIFALPNKRLFKDGINLVILNIPDLDMTANVELICPTNHYLSHPFDSRKKTAIIVKRGNIFEPIYLYKNTGNKIIINKYFTEYDVSNKNDTITKTIKTVFTKIIRPILKNECLPLPSLSRKIYNFKQPILLYSLINYLKRKNYIIQKQVLNFENKVIGIIATDTMDITGYIPCYPSALTVPKKKIIINPETNKKEEIYEDEYDFIFMDDISWLKSYEETLQFLLNYYEVEENQNVNCNNGFCRVIEDGVISGFLTDTNQFIPINPPKIKNETTEDFIEDIIYSDSSTIPNYKGEKGHSNLYQTDISILTNRKPNNERSKFVKKIEMETNYYNIFRNVIRILLSDYKNNELRKKIINNSNDLEKPYLEKLNDAIILIKELTNGYVNFISKDLNYYMDVDVNELQNCVTNEISKCNNTCMITDDKCGVILPKNNLITEKDNEELYFKKIADELIRYNRIASFIFKPNSYLSFLKTKYKINADEIILMQEMITQEYFRELREIGVNKFKVGQTYDTASPIISNTYNNRKILNDVINPHYEKNECIKVMYEDDTDIPLRIYNRNIRMKFPNNYSEMIYKGSILCPFYLIIDLANKFKNEILDVDKLKNILVEEYLKYTENMENVTKMKQVISILHESGNIDTNQLQEKTLDFEELIMNYGFIPTNFDIWILLNRLEIPSIFVSEKYIAETRYNSHEFITFYDDVSDSCAVIVIPAQFKRKYGMIPTYKLILNENLESDIPISVIETNNEFITAYENKISIEKYIEKFVKDNKTKYLPKKPDVRNNPKFDEDKPVRVTPEMNESKKKYNIEYSRGNDRGKYDTMSEPKKIPLKRREKNIRNVLNKKQEKEQEQEFEDVNIPIENEEDIPLDIASESSNSDVDLNIEEPSSNNISEPIEYKENIERKITKTTIPLKETRKNTNKKGGLKNRKTRKLIIYPKSNK